MSSEEKLESAKESLLRIQNFDPKELTREGDLGRQLSFANSVDHARRIIALFRRVPIEILGDLTPSFLQRIKEQADADYNRFKSVLEYSASQPNAVAERESLMAQIEGGYDAAFDVLWQFIAFGVARLTDTAVLENQARAVLQGIDDSSKKFNDRIAESEEEAQRILKNIKDVALEQGVSQQAEFFKTRADEHEASAGEWRKYTLVASAVLAVFVLISLFIHKWEWLAPTSMAQVIQFTASKIVLFSVLAYWMVLSAKNFLAHKHNAVINRHRQTALQTYRVLADASGAGGTEDIILAHASACIFGPQDTGFSRSATSDGGSKSILELLTKTTSSASSTS